MSDIWRAVFGLEPKWNGGTMAGIKSINEPRAPLDSELKVPKIATQAIAEPARPTTTYFTLERIQAMQIYADRLYVATEGGVYILGVDGIFKRMRFEIVEEQNE